MDFTFITAQGPARALKDFYVIKHGVYCLKVPHMIPRSRKYEEYSTLPFRVYMGAAERKYFFHSHTIAMSFIIYHVVFRPALYEVLFTHPLRPASETISCSSLFALAMNCYWFLNLVQSDQVSFELSDKKHKDRRVARTTL